MIKNRNSYRPCKTTEQCPQRFALIGIAIRHSGQSFVIDAGASSFFFILFKPRISMNIAKATIMKSIMVLMKTPYFSNTAGPATVASLSVIEKPLKSRPPIIIPSGGISTSATNELMIFPNAAPMIIPIAMSTTLPRIANVLNSFIIDIVTLLSKKMIYPMIEHGDWIIDIILIILAKKVAISLIKVKSPNFFVDLLS